MTACKIAGCDRKSRANGMCAKHNMRAARHDGDTTVGATRYNGTRCSFADCWCIARARGFCLGHYNQQISGQPLRPLRPWGPQPPQVADNGYLQTFDRRVGRMVGVHRIVMEGIIGRPLEPGESVHHVNGNRADNRPDNLELWAKSQPAGQQVVDLLAWAREIIDRYGPLEDRLHD